MHRALRAARKEAVVTVFYWVGGIVALALLVYLFAALLEPEAF